MRLAIILLQACLETQLAFMNHFPLFAPITRAKDPWRLPGTAHLHVREPALMRNKGGIYFSIEQMEHGRRYAISVEVCEDL